MTEKSLILIHNLYEEQPADFAGALEQAVWFLNGGFESTEEDKGIRSFSWSKDANLIFAAFQQTHGIDLQTVEGLHWWKFLALFMDLGGETVFCNLVGLRRRVQTGRASKEERRMAREIGQLFEVVEIDDRTLEEREAEAAFLAEVQRAKERRQHVSQV